MFSGNSERMRKSRVSFNMQPMARLRYHGTGVHMKRGPWALLLLLLLSNLLAAVATEQASGDVGSGDTGSGEHGSGGSGDSEDNGNGLVVGLGVGGGVVVVGAVGVAVVAANGGFAGAAAVAAPVVGALSKFGAASRGGTLPMMPVLVPGGENV